MIHHSLQTSGHAGQSTSDENLTARLKRPSSHKDITSMKSVMLEDEGRRAGAATKTPAEVAEKIKKHPPTRLRRGTYVR